MDLQLLVDEGLWASISETYNAGNYKNSILEAIQFLTDTIREKSGFDGDGQQLIGRVFGGKNPLLKINKFQTQTEKDIQKGIEFLIRGLYLGIRNPRSHEQINDDLDTTNKLILFIDFIIEQIEKSSPPFTSQGFLNQILDTHFVKSDEYVNLLVSEIPKIKLYDTLIELFRHRNDRRTKNIPFVMKKIYDKLEINQSYDFKKLLSEELRTANDFITQILPFQILEPENWLEIDKMARIRIENIVAESIEEGECLARSKTINGAGALATWAKDFLPYFGNTNKIISILSKKLQGQYEGQLYVFSFFLTPLPELFKIKSLSSKCIKNICNAVKKEQDFVGGGLRTILEEEFWKLPDEWQTIIIECLPEFKKFDIDDIPF